MPINKNDNYLKLFNAIKNTKKDDNYKPKKYNFGLRDFDEKDNVKKRES